MQSDEQIEFWLNRMNEIAKHSRSEKQIESDLDDLEEQIKDRLEDQNLNFEDESRQPAELICLNIINEIQNSFRYPLFSYMFM